MGLLSTRRQRRERQLVEALFAEREERARPFNLAGQVLQPPQGTNNNFLAWFFGGPVVDGNSAASLPAVTAAVRLVAETTASLPLNVYSGIGSDKRPAPTTKQWDLLTNAPNPEQSAFDFVCDLAACVEWCGNALIQKVKLDGKVVELWPLDPSYVSIVRDAAGNKQFQVRVQDGRIRAFDESDIIHIRGFSHTGGLVGYSPITLFREPIASEIQMQEFVGKFFRNDARPGVVLKFPTTVTVPQAKEWTDLWNSEHAGSGNAHKTGVIGGGGDIETVPISLQDAQFIESRRFGTTVAAQMFRVPATLLEGTPEKLTTEQISLNFLNFSLLPRLKRIERALSADLDLFGDSNLYPQFHVDEFLRTDANTRASVLHNLKQSGILTANEARAELGLPPIDGGDELQVTPVGGAPNPQPDETPTDAVHDGASD